MKTVAATGVSVGQTTGNGEHTGHARTENGVVKLNLVALLPGATYQQRERAWRHYCWAHGYLWEFRTVGARKVRGIFARGFYCIGRVGGEKCVVSRQLTMARIDRELNDQGQ